MPTRLKREFVDDIRFRELSVYAERFYHRLHSKADDHGRYFGDLTILRSKLHPWDFDSVRNTDMSRWIAECEKVRLVRCYTHEGQRFIVVLNFDQRARSESKFPDPPFMTVKCPSYDGQMPAVCEGADEDEGAHSGVRANDGQKPKAKLRPIVDIEADPAFAAFWDAWPRDGCKEFPAYARKKDRFKCALGWSNSNFGKIADEIMRGLVAAKRSKAWKSDKGKYIPLPMTWLNGRRWADAIDNDRTSGEDWENTQYTPE